MTHRVLVTETIAESGLAILRAAEDVDLDFRPGLKGDDLMNAVADADAVITRSGTAVTKELLEHGAKLRVVGRAGVGLDNVDVDACTARGILVVNAPTANVMSATEHTMAMLLALCRNIPEAHASVKRGEWTRAKFMGTELDGKTLGVIGLGRIGTRVATRARAFGMRVIAYDPYISAFGETEKVTLDQLLAEADVITVHTPLNRETHGMLGAEQIAKMKSGVKVLNIARGGIYDERALADALNSGKIAGAAIDVYEEEPPGAGHPLLNAKNVILSPHIGANTMEAQDRVSATTAKDVIEALRGSIFVSAVNLPFEAVTNAKEKALVMLAEKLGLFAAQVAEGPISRATLEARGIGEKKVKILKVATLKGILTPHLADVVNYFNAEQLADERGISIAPKVDHEEHDYTEMITLRGGSETQEVCVTGTLLKGTPRIVSVDNFLVEFRPEGYLLRIVNEDVPGVIGRVGTILGDYRINIADYNLARNMSGGKAMAIVTVDSPPEERVMAALRNAYGVEEVKLVRL